MTGSVLSDMLLLQVHSNILPSFAVITLNCFDITLTSDAPTPFVPDTMPLSSVKFEPDRRAPNNISGSHSSYSGCLMIAMPPLSQTAILPVAGQTIADMRSTICALFSALPRTRSSYALLTSSLNIVFKESHPMQP